MSARRFGCGAVVVTLLWTFGAPLGAQSDPLAGTWVLNVDKSQFMAPGAAIRQRTLVITPKGDLSSHEQETYRVGQDAVTKIWFDAKYDGKDYKAMGAAFDTVTFTRKGNTWTRVAKNQAKDVETATYTLSADGRTLTIMTTGNNLGVMYSSTQVFEKRAGGTN